MARCERCDGPESMFSFKPCKWCAYPGPDTRSHDQMVADATSCHVRVWGWDHAYQPDEAGECITCRSQC
jgi:hypothetical protein